jgi:O-antigen ligase
MMALFRLTQVFLFLLPFQAALSPLHGVDLPFSRIFVPILFMVYVAIRLLKKRLLLPFSIEIGLLSVYAFTAFLSILWASDVSWALRRALFLLNYLPLVPVYIGLSREYTDGIYKLVRAFVGGAALSAAVGISAFLLQFGIGVPRMFHFWTGSILPFFLGASFAESVAQYPSLLVNIDGQTLLRVSAFFPDPHMAAFYFGMAFPIAVVLVFTSSSTRRRFWYGLAAGTILVADVLTFSRGGYVGLASGFLLWLIINYDHLLRSGHTRVTLPALFTTAFLVIILLSPVKERMISALSLDDGSNSGRIEIYREAIGKIIAQPFGYGLGNYSLAVKPTAGYREPIYAHNLYLDIATESGIVSATCIFIALVAAIVRLSRSKTLLLSAGSISLAIFFGHSIFETPLYSVHVLPVFLLLFSFSQMTMERKDLA